MRVLEAGSVLRKPALSCNALPFIPSGGGASNMRRGFSKGLVDLSRNASAEEFMPQVSEAAWEEEWKEAAWKEQKWRHESRQEEPLGS